jgi:hypothetical protein
MKAQDFKGFIYKTGEVVTFDFNHEHKEFIPNMQDEINQGGIRIIVCQNCFGAQIGSFSYSVFQRIYDFLSKNGMLNYRIGVDNENLEHHKSMNFQTGKEFMQYMFSL